MLTLAAKGNSSLYGLLIAFAALTLIFFVAERLWPSIPKQKILRRGYGVDLIYWFFTPLIAKSFTKFAVGIAALLVLGLLGMKAAEAGQYEGFGPISRLPDGVQLLLGIFIVDFMGYWSHRWFHVRKLWPFHAVHHSSVDLDWLSSTRLHPVNDLGSKLCQTIPLIFLGFKPGVSIGFLTTFLTFYSIAIHANLNWTYGPFKYVVASPMFHRWHHTKQAEGLDKNFAGLLPLWDILFGTFYMPKGRIPVEFGIDGPEPMPEGIIGQMIYPFRRRRPAVSVQPSPNQT